MGVRLEDVTPGVLLGGITGANAVTVVVVRWIGSNAIQLTYRTPDERLDERLLYRDHGHRLTLRQASAAYDFTADGALFKLAAEALRIRMAARFDPMLAVHTSDLEPLPHQIEAVYGELLERTPFRFLLAYHPSAGKTIMAGLYAKELILCGDLERCLIVAHGTVVEQWQEKLADRFGLRFELLTRQLADAAIDENVRRRFPLLIATGWISSRARTTYGSNCTAAIGIWWSSTRHACRRVHPGSREPGRRHGPPVPGDAPRRRVARRSAVALVRRVLVKASDHSLIVTMCTLNFSSRQPSPGA